MIAEVLQFGKGLRIPLLINVVYSVVLRNTKQQLIMLAESRFYHSR